MANDNRRKLFDAMQSAGYDIGSYEDFDRRMNNESDRQKFFIAVNEAGYDIGSYNDFDRRIRDSKYKLNVGGKQVPVSEQQYKDFIARKNQPTQQPITEKPVTKQPTQQVQQVQSQPKPQQQPQPRQQGTPMTEAERIAMQMQTGETIHRARQSQDSFSRRMENIRKGNTIGQSSQQKFNPVTGQMERRYYTTTGNEVESSLEQSRENLAERDRWEATTEEGRKHRSQRMTNDFYERVGAAVNKYDPDNAAATVWQRAEDKANEEFGRYLNERNKPSLNNFIRGAAEGTSVTGGLGADNVDTGIKAFATHLKYHDLQRMADDAWNMLGKEKQQSIIEDMYGALKNRYPQATEQQLQQAATEMAREQSDRRMYELAVAKNAPKDAAEYFIRKVAAGNAMGTLMQAAARAQAGTTGDWEAREDAEQRFEKQGHKVAGIAGTVTGFALDPLTWASAGAGGAAVKGSTWLGGKIIGEAAMRKFGTTLGGRMLGGAIGGAVNFGTYEAGSEVLDQTKWGGYIDEETGERKDGFSFGNVAGRAGHGLMMGAATGVIAPYIGNVSDKLVRATESTVGKMGIRAAELGVGTIAEGTIFSVPEWIEGSRDAMDVWTDNMAMMAGFKAQHMLKSAPRVIGELAASRRGKAGFETRLRSILDGRGDLALTADEKEELKSKGYTDLKDLTDEYGRYIKAKEQYDKARPASTDGKTLMIEGEVRDLPYNRFVELMNDGTVSEAARAKMYYYLTGHILPMSTVIGSNIIETKDTDGRVTGYTVQSFGANGVITSRTFGSRERADVEANRINRQAELNSIDVGERYFDWQGDNKRMYEACEAVADETGAPANLLFDLMKHKTEAMNEVELQWAEKILNAYNGLGDKYGSSEVRTAINDEFGVDIDKAIRKEPGRRSEQEQKAVEEYASRLFADVRRKQEEAAEREESPVNPDAPTTDSKIAALLGIDDEEQPDNPVSDSFSRGHDADIQERKDIAIELANGNTDAQSAWDGVVQRINEDAAYMAAQERERAKKIQNKDDGTFRTATLRETDEDGNSRQVYIVAGNVAMTQDGTAVDTSASDKTISIYDPATGEPRMIDPSEIAALGSVTSAEQYEADIEQKRYDYIQTQIDEAQGTVQIVPGGNVTLPTGEEALVLGTMDADGENVLVQVGDRRDVVKRSDIQQAADDRAMEDYRQRHGIQGEESKPEEGMQNGAPSEYVNGMEIVIREQDGDYGTFGEKTGLVLRRVRAEMRNGRIEYVPDAEGSLVEYLVGDEVRHDHIADLNNMIVRHSSDVQQNETESGSPASLAGIRRERTQDGQQQDEYEPAEEYETPIGSEFSEDEYEPAELPEYGYDEGNYQRVMPMVGEGEDAEPDFLATKPQRGHRYLYEEARLPRKVADNIVSANLSAAEKELKKQQKAIDTLDGNPGTSIAQYQKKRRDLEDKLNSAQVTHDYWQAVKAEQDKVVAAEAAERARQESALHEQAVSDEQRRQEQELAKRREQEERGANAVSPSIREKWDNAPKVEGAENEITLANGEMVKGRYMLVESGAATPSHNPNAEFARNEGFPVDENGQTVNDRDYERDRDAQNITRQMAAQYDSRAIQSVPVVSRDGIVLSGNGRTMAGELAAQNNTDGAYIGHLQKYPQQFGFTTEQVQAMDHPRVVFVPDEAMPYTTDTFAKFNQQDMKSQSRTEQSVKLGKTVDDSIFNRIIQSINTFDSISDFYNDAQASTNAIAELRNAGVINAMQYAEMFDGDKVSMTGRQMLENMLVGKAFESNPDAIRQLAEYPSMRQSVISALAEISNNVALGEDYSLETELAESINLAYQARKSGYKAGDVVSNYARQLNLFPFDEGSETVADYTNAAVLMLADVLNDSRTGMLKKTLALYNREAADSAAGQTDLFSGGVKTKQEILKEVLNILNYGTENQQRTALAAAAEQRKADAAAGQGGGGEGVQPNGTTGESGTEGTDAAIRITEPAPVEPEPTQPIKTTEWNGHKVGDRYLSPNGDGETAEIIGFDYTHAGESGMPEVLLRGYDKDGNLLGTDAVPALVFEDNVRDLQKLEAEPNAVQTAIRTAEQETDTNPTDAQKEAGNYKKGHVRIDGFDVTIENPKGSKRSGTDKDGKRWEVTMNNTYGYIRGTEGVDGDHIDVFLSDNMDGWNGTVYVVDQINADGTFDEHKVMYGFNSEQEAREAYLANYSEGWQGLGAITGVSKDEFTKWIDSSHRKTKPFAEYKSVKTEEGQSEQQPVNVEEEPAETSGNGYTITPATYTTKKGKELAMQLVTFDNDLTKEQKRAADKLAREKKGWFDRSKNGYMMRSEADAEELAKLLGSEKAVQEAQPVSLADIQSVTDEAESRPQEQTETTEQPQETPQPEQKEDVSEQETASSQQQKEQKEQKEPKSKYVSDEDAERFAQLKERLKQKLRGQMNMGIDPEIFTLGVEMTYMIVKNQARKFAEYAKAMIEEMGDAIRPYLKTFYNGARDLPELEDIAGELTPYEEVRAFDVANFDKEGAKDLIGTAEVVSKEDEANRQAEQAKEKITKSRNERLDREMEVKRTAAHFPMETPEEAAAFDRRIPDMSDEELLAYMKEDGNGDTNKAFHTNLYDEYDYRHNQEEADAYDRYLQQLRESDTTSEQAEEMLGNLYRDMSQFATEDRPLLLGQEEALQDYMSELRNERSFNETEGNSQADTDVLSLPQPIKDNPNYSKEEQESLMYRKGESMEEYGERNNKYPNNWEALYLTQKYSDRMDDIANILSSLSAENADEVGKAIADIVERRSEGYELLSLLRDIPVDAVLPYQDAVSAAFEAKESKDSGKSQPDQPTLQLTSEQEEKPKKPRTTASSKGKIEDVGEKIGGARKDIVQATVDRININGETFSKIFPKFDYHKLIKEGLDPKLAAGLSHVAQIAKDEYKRRKRRLGEQRALSMARFYANYAKGYLLGDTSLDFSNEGWVFTEYGKNVIGFGIEAWERLYDALGEDMFDIDLSGFEVGYIMKQDNANIKNYYYRDGERIDARYGIRAGQTKYFTEDEKEEALQYLVDGVKKAISYKASHPFKLGAYYTPGVKDSGYIGAKIGGKVIQLTPKGKEYGLKYLDEHNAELQLLAQRKAEELKEERKNSKQIAQVVVISGQTSYKKKFAVKIGGKYVDLSDEMFSFETSDYSKKHLEEMQAKAQELLDEYNKEHGDGKGWKPEMNIGGQRKRVGKDWREGRDVSATELMNKFGFRGVEFGNYVTQKERQRLINECYDAFMDMADVLGVSPRALSLNGELGMAIGARGIGGAAAHYEPAKNVINLTKKNGWGALAHEWWHSLDYYFGQREKAKPATASYFKEGVRKEMEEAFEKVMDRIKGSDYLKRSRSLDRKTNKDYYSKDTELGARAFQDYIEKKLTERGQVNDFLSHFTTKEDWNGERETYPYPIEEEGQKIGNAFESFFDTIQEREDENGNVVLFQRVDDSAMHRESDAVEEAMRDEVVRLMREAGIDVSTDWEAGQRILDDANAGLREMRAYHGSGADFNRFDHSFIGTGEGNQAFGWGTYVSEVEGVGRGYAKRIGDMKVSERRFIEGKIEEAKRYNIPAQVEYWENELKRKNLKNTQHYLYEVEIPKDDGGNYIDYFAKMQDQQGILDKIDNYMTNNEVYGFKWIRQNPDQRIQFRAGNRLITLTPNQSGADLYEEFKDAFGAKPASEILHAMGITGIKVPVNAMRGGNEKGEMNYVIFNENDLQITDRLNFFRTSSGEAYGFTLNGKVYLDPRIATAETPIHEYAHLWAQALRKANPKAWDKLKSEMLKEQDVVDYVKRLYPDITNEDELLEEVFTHYGGRRGAEMLRQQMQSEMEKADGATEKAKIKTIFDKLRDILSKFWNMARDLFAGNNKNLAGMKGEDFADMMMNDLINGFNPNVKDNSGVREQRGSLDYELSDFKKEKGLSFLRGVEKADITIGGKRVGRVFKTDEGYYAETPMYDFATETYPTADDAVKALLNRNDTEEGVLFRDSSTPIFYSNAARAVEQVRQEKATPEQWLKMIEKNGGLKSGEDKWIGLSDWLKESKAKSLTKQEVMDYILSNQIQIEETEYGDKTLGRYDEHWDYLRNWLEENTDNPDAWYNTITEYYGYRDGEGFFLNQGARMPKQVTDMVDRINKSIGKSNPINSTRLSYTTQGLENKREIALTVPTIESWNTQDEIHFGDAGQGRAVAWVRFGETEGVPNDVDADRYHDYSRKMKEAISRRDEMVENIKRYKGGMLTETQKRLEEEEAYIQQLRERYKDVADVKPSRVLVIDEIQSKRHQEGREKGYKRKNPISKEEANRQFNEFYFNVKEKYGNKPFAEWSLEDRNEYQRLDRQRTGMMVLNSDALIPDAPFEKNWHELAMKRMLRYAAENGYDKVAWTTGEQQAERYNIGNVVHSIQWGKKGDNKWVRINSNNNHLDLTFIIDEKGTILENKQEFSSYGSEFVGKPLSDVVGKEVAKKILNDEGEKHEVNLASIHSVHYSLEGDGLRIGGEGMKGFYDKILPSFMNKYGKKWGVKVGTVELPNVEESARTMWSIDVTPEMVQSVMEGQPMFRIREDAPPTKTGTGYKVFVLKDGKLYPPMVANPNGEATPVGVWLDADAAPVAGVTKTGRQQVKAGGKGTQGGSGKLAYRPGWHLGEIPYALQFNRINPETGQRELFPANFVWAEVEYADDVDYQEEAMSYGMNENGKFQHSFAGLPRVPENGSYKYRTNPNPDTDPWIITGAMKVNRILKPSEVDAMVEAAGREPQQRQAGAITDEQVEALNTSIRSAMQEDSDMKRSVASQMGDRLNTRMNIIEDVNDITHPNKKIQERQRRSKGWYDPVTGQVYVVLPNNRDVDDVKATIGHETVAHKGLRELVGEERYNEFLDETYRHLRDDLKQDVDDAAGREFLNGLNNNNGRKTRSYEECRRIAVDELFGRMAEKPFEDFSEGERTLWQRIKDAVRKILDRFLGSLKLPDWFELGDNELRYILWRSKERLERGKESPIDFARDIVKREELGLTNDDIRFRDPDETEDIWNDQSLSLQESITAAKTRLASRHSDNRTLRNDAMRAIGGNLSDLRRAMSLQRTFDMTTVKRVSDLARILMDSGYLNDLTQQEVKRLLAAVKNSVGREDIESSVQKVMDIMVDNQLKQGENTLHELEAIKGSKVDARGVEVQGQLDPAGAHIMKVFKKTRGWDKTDVEEAIADAQQRMGSSDAAVADEAALEYTGLQLAMEYAENIKDSKVEERKLREEIKQAHDTTSERDRATDSYRQYIASLQEAIRQNKIERAQGYFDLVGRLSDSLRGSIANAKEFKESEKRRIREIQHNANSDMEGRPSDEHYKPKFMDKFVNNAFVSFVFAPLSTFEQMLRMFGGKSANGEGYLFNRFMRGWVDARQKEIRGVRDKYSVLDAKAAELFGGKVRTWGDLIRRVGKLPKGTVSFWNGGEMKEYEMTQGNLMYIYMVNKMLDGRMKLRKMGITDEDVANIENVLDPRLIELADWLQDEFLVETRNEYNETHKRMFGASMAAIEHYFPLKILANARADKPEDLDNPDKGDGISTATGSIIKRRRNTLALDITGADALSVILDHVAQMEHWNAFAEFNRDLNTLRTYKRFRNQVQNMTTIYGSGKKLWKKFNDVCQMAAGTYRPPRAMLDEAAVNFAKGVTTSAVSFRMFTALKQLLSMPAYIPDARADYLARNIANPVGAWKWSMEHLPIFNERWRSRMVGDPRLMKSDMDWKQWRSRIVQLASRVGMSPNAFVDALTVSIGAHSIYQTRLAQYLRDGYGQADAERKAVQDAEMLYNLTQQSSEGAFTSTMQVDRSWLSVLFTVFRNASMSYQRQLHDALRNFKHNLTPGGRARSIEFMKKQLLREWNSPVDADGNWSEEDSARAEQTARRKFKRQLRRDAVRVATFGYIVQLAWNLGAHLPYILFGDDDDEKQKAWYDAWTHAIFGGVEGLTGGDVMSLAGQMMITGDGNPAYLNKDMPFTSEVIQVFKKLGNGQHAEALNDMINLVIQVGIGVNPQSITDGVLAILDACNNDVELANEATICISRILQIPQSQIEKMYLDEVGLDGKDVKNYTFSQLAERYARYRVRRSRLFAPWSWDDEERIDKEKERLSGKYKERLELKGDDALRDIFDSSSGDMELRKMAGSEIAKHLGGRDSYGSPKSEYGQIYLQERSYVDIAEDVLLQTAESQAKENGDTEREKAIKRARANITDIKKALAETPYTDAEGNKVTAEDVMGRLRKTRRELMDELDIETQ